MEERDESTFLNPASVLTSAKLRPGMRVADFDAGSGFFTRAAAREVGERGVVWAVDQNQDLLVRLKNMSAAEGLNNVEIIRGNIEGVGGTNLPPSSFDLVIIANTLFTLADPLGAAKEAHRVLASNGRALVVDWKDSFEGLGPHPGHVVTVGAGRDLFEKAGFVYIEDIPAGAYHWGFTVRKKEHPTA